MSSAEHLKHPQAETISYPCGLQVMSFQTEEEVLLRWRDLVLETDPDIIIGYNTSNFDLPYLINRAAALKLNKFPYWGRMRNKCGLP